MRRSKVRPRRKPRAPAVEEYVRERRGRDHARRELVRAPCRRGRRRRRCRLGRAREAPRGEERGVEVGEGRGCCAGLAGVLVFGTGVGGAECLEDGERDGVAGCVWGGFRLSTVVRNLVRRIGGLSSGFGGRRSGNVRRATFWRERCRLSCIRRCGYGARMMCWCMECVRGSMRVSGTMTGMGMPSSLQDTTDCRTVSRTRCADAQNAPPLSSTATSRDMF